MYTCVCIYIYIYIYMYTYPRAPAGPPMKAPQRAAAKSVYAYIVYTYNRIYIYIHWYIYIYIYISYIYIYIYTYNQVGGMARIARQGTLSGFPCAVNNQLRTGPDKGNPTVYLKQSIAMASEGVDAMWCLPSALSVKVMGWWLRLGRYLIVFDPLTIPRAFRLDYQMTRSSGKPAYGQCSY